MPAMTKPVGRPRKKPKRQVPVKVEIPLADAIDEWVEATRLPKQEVIAAAILHFMLTADRDATNRAMDQLVAWLQMNENERPATKIAQGVAKSFGGGGGRRGS